MALGLAVLLLGGAAAAEHATRPPPSSTPSSLGVTRARCASLAQAISGQRTGQCTGPSAAEQAAARKQAIALCQKNSGQSEQVCAGLVDAANSKTFHQVIATAARAVNGVVNAVSGNTHPCGYPASVRRMLCKLVTDQGGAAPTSRYHQKYVDCCIENPG